MPLSFSVFLCRLMDGWIGRLCNIRAGPLESGEAASRTPIAKAFRTYSRLYQFNTCCNPVTWAVLGVTRNKERENWQFDTCAKEDVGVDEKLAISYSEQTGATEIGSRESADIGHAGILGSISSFWVELKNKIFFLLSKIGSRKRYWALLNRRSQFLYFGEIIFPQNQKSTGVALINMSNIGNM